MAANAAPPRLPPIPLEAMTPAQRSAAEAIMAGPRKGLRGPFNAWLRSPDLADRLQRVGEYLRFNSSLDKRLNELAILITARHWNSPFEWYAHYPLAIAAGLDPQVAAELAQGKRPTTMHEDETIVWEFCTQLRQNKNVNNVTYQAALTAFGEIGIVDLIAVSGYYDTVSMTLNVAGVLPPEPGPVPLLPK